MSAPSRADDVLRYVRENSASLRDLIDESGSVAAPVSAIALLNTFAALDRALVDGGRLPLDWRPAVAPDAEESLRERVARAMFDADDWHPDLWDQPNWEGTGDYRRRADTAIRAMRGDS